MKKLENHKEYMTTYQAIALDKKSSFVGDLLQLLKIRLSLTVVFSAVLSYIIVLDGSVLLTDVLILALGGLFITGSANALNEVLEKDYDRLMKRTQFRPLPDGRMSVSQAVLIAGVMFVVGIIMLAFFNQLAATLGAIAVVTYAFVYTPLKRIGPASVFIGAISGALPCLIGAVAAEGSFSYMALVLFGIQFLWQFPHFWSIGFLGHKDYQKAGFRLVPESNGNVHPNLGLQSAFYAALLMPLVFIPFVIGKIALASVIVVAVLSLIYCIYGLNLQQKKDHKAAKALMFYSIAYMPTVLLTYLFGIL